MRRKAGGDAADILQMVEWQAALYAGRAPLERIEGAARLVKESQTFADAWERRKRGPAEYPALLKPLLAVYRATIREFPHADLEGEVTAMETALKDPAALERAHRGYLLKLQAATDAAK